MTNINNEKKVLVIDVILAGTASLIFIGVMIISIMFPTNETRLLYIFEFIIASIIMFGAGISIFKSAVEALKAKTTNIDTLISIGIFTTWLFSTTATFFPNLTELQEKTGQIYFETIVFIVFFILMGKLLDTNSKNKTISAIKELPHVQSNADPNITKLVEEAKSTKSYVPRIADKISSVFVPTVLIIALGTFCYWNFYTAQGLKFALFVAITVLIIACPCALGLATPTALMVGMGNAAQLGILIKNAQALETAKNITHVVFDKTKTITKGIQEVQQIHYYCTPREVEQTNKYMYSIEKTSSQPVACAIVKYFEAQSYANATTVVDLQDIKDVGQKGKIYGHEISIVNKKFLDDYKINPDLEVLERLSKMQTETLTVSIVLLDGVVIALVGIADSVKDGVKDTIADLKKLNIKTTLITADIKAVAKKVAKDIGIDEVIAEASPAIKLAKIKELQRGKNIVAMVGDDLADAPALAQANIGFIMGNGDDTAIDAGNIVIADGNIQKVYDTIIIAKHTTKTLHQNLFWAFSYNIVGIPIAAGIFYYSNGVLLSPVFAGMTMAFSAISVVFNSLSLKLTK